MINTPKGRTSFKICLWFLLFNSLWLMSVTSCDKESPAISYPVLEDSDQYLFPLEGEMSEWQVGRCFMYYNPNWSALGNNWILLRLIEHGNEPIVRNTLLEYAEHDDPSYAVYAVVGLIALNENRAESLNRFLELWDSAYWVPLDVLVRYLDPVEDIEFIHQLVDLSPRNITYFPTIYDLKTLLLKYSCLAGDGDHETNLRIWAVSSLGTIVDDDPSLRNDPEIMSVLYRIAREGENLAYQAVNAIGKHGYSEESQSILIEIINSDLDWFVRSSALGQLMQIGDREVSLDTFSTILNNPQTRDFAGGYANFAVYKFGPDPDFKNQLINYILRKPEPHEGITFDAIRRYGPDAVDAIPRLYEILRECWQDSGQINRTIQAIYTLGSIGEAANTALPFLQQRIDGYIPNAPPDEYISSDWVHKRSVAAIQAAGLIAGQESDIFPLIYELCLNSHGIIQVVAVNALANIDDDGDLVIPLLNELLEDDHNTPVGVIAHFRLYLYGIDEQVQIDALVNLLNSSDDRVVHIAVWALGYMLEPESPAVKRLEELFLFPI